MGHILVTGGAGFIGSNLIARLLQNSDHAVTSLDNFEEDYPRKIKERNISRFANFKNYRFIEGDIRNANDLEAIKNVSVIIHLAGKAGVRNSFSNEASYCDNNVEGTRNLLEYAKRNQIKQFVYASSSSVYGLNENMPWAENEALLPISPYAKTKISAEQLGREYSANEGIRFMSLRLFSVYGPAQRPDLVISQFLNSISKQLPISVYGNGTSKRDYTYVDDVVNGIISAIYYDQSWYEEINLGGNEPTELNQVIQFIEALCGQQAIIHRCAEQPGDLPFTHGDLSKAAKLLNYKPRVSLADGLSRFYAWYKEMTAEKSF